MRSTCLHYRTPLRLHHLNNRDPPAQVTACTQYLIPLITATSRLHIYGTPRARLIYRTDSLRPPGYLVKVTALTDKIKYSVFIFSKLFFNFFLISPFKGRP